ncbi:MAG TPA: biotin/lipoate A/B protein ligase family protein [archaeon]|nr:biotin/lipoate A/B protein ligase family protein [archaeon]
MALDEIFLRRAQRDNLPPVLRVYSWIEPSVSIGYNQKAERELDLELCRKLGVRVVRRPTGGRSVYHARELTYSVAGPGNTEWLGRTTGESCRLIARGILRSLALLGVEPDLARNPVKQGRNSSPKLANPCFTSVSRYEISCNGRKLVGSAQRRLSGGRALLQQGSLLLHNTQGRLVELMTGSRSAEERSRLAEDIEQQAAGLAEILGRPVDFAEAADAFRRGFGEAFGCSLVPGEPTDEETELARRLEEERYNSRMWLLGKKKEPYK